LTIALTRVNISLTLFIMKTWVCTTLCNFFTPSLGAARLYAYVKNQGHSVRFKDLNQDAYFRLLSGDYLGPAIEKIGHSIDALSRNRFLREDLGAVMLHSSDNVLKQMVARGVLRHKPWYRFLEKTRAARGPLLRIAGAMVKPENVLYALLSEREYVLAEVEKSRKVLDESFLRLDPAEFIANFATLLCGKAIMDMTCFPAQLDFGLGFNGTAYSPRAGDIVRAVDDERHNFLIPYYRSEVLPALAEESPGVVGISVTCFYEMVPAFTLAHMIKQASPETHIVLGGVLTTQLAERIAGNQRLWDMFDSLIMGPGEVAFSELIESVEKKKDLAGVPNIIYRKNGSVCRGEKQHVFDINETCTPDFGKLRPGSGVPLETASGCYWGKCIFCYYPKTGTATYDSSYQKKRVRAIELVMEDIRTLRDKYDPLAIGITDSSLHPRRMEAIAEENMRSGKGVKFSALFRMEKQFKSSAFCRKLAEGGFLGGYVGLESGSQRVNDIINKGIDLDDAGVIIKNFYEAGILLHVFSIVGIPGETEEDARMTRDFFKRWHRWLTLDWVVYHLYVLEQSPLAQRAPEFGLKLTPLPEDYIVEFMLYHPEKGLSQERSVSLSISFGEELKRYGHPLNRIMDIESMVLFLLLQQAKGIPPRKVKKTGPRL